MNEKVLSVKAQVSVEKNNKSDVRFVTTVDDICYKKVGSIIAYDMDGDGVTTTTTSVSSKVYSTLYYMDGTDGSVMEYYPDKEFSLASKYFKATTITKVPQKYYDMEFEVTPYWETLDGTIVNGVTTIKTINQSN